MNINFNMKNFSHGVALVWCYFLLQSEGKSDQITVLYINRSSASFHVHCVFGECLLLLRKDRSFSKEWRVVKVKSFYSCIIDSLHWVHRNSLLCGNRPHTGNNENCRRRPVPSSNNPLFLCVQARAPNKRQIRGSSHAKLVVNGCELVERSSSKLGRRV